MSKLFSALLILVLSLQTVIAQEGITKELFLSYIMTRIPTIYIKALGPVKSIHPETFSLKRINGKWVEGEKYRINVIHYNPDKSKIEDVLLRDDGKVFRKGVYSLDSNWKLINWDLYEADGRHSGTKTIYTYNKDGQISEAVHYLLGSFSFKETFSYTDKNRLEVTRQFESHPNELNREIYIYDSSGNIKEVIFMDEDVKGRATYQYDKRGNPISYSVYSKSGSLMEKATYIYEFDKNGNWIKTRTTEYDADKDEAQRHSYRITKRKIIYY